MMIDGDGIRKLHARLVILRSRARVCVQNQETGGWCWCGVELELTRAEYHRLVRAAASAVDQQAEDEPW